MAESSRKRVHPDICVVRYSVISVDPSATITIPGQWNPPGRAIAFVSDETLMVAGTLDVSAKGIGNGPGAALTSSTGPTPNLEGGGGAGGRTAGASGATRTMDGAANNGGPPTADPATFAVFQGGAPAYKLNRGNNDGPGGGGGGALLLISCKGNVEVDGIISAGGGGGRGGGAAFQLPIPGAGGGAGGYVVLQGIGVSVAGKMFANGGSGGNGVQSDGQSGADGADAVLSTTRGTYSAAVNGEGVGGRGGAGDLGPQAGLKPATTTAGAGGGGGSVGFFQTYTPPGRSPNVTSTALSPRFQTNGELQLR